MMKIAFCDDNIYVREHLNSIITELQSNYNCQSSIDFSYKIFEDGDALLYDIEHGIHYDIIFLDILMPFINGIDVAKEIREFDDNVQIVFLTSSPEFALDSYSVDALDYLLKPVTSDKIISSIEKALHLYKKTESESIVVASKKTYRKIYLNTIEYVEVSKRLLSFHLHDGKIIETLGTLADYEAIFLSHKQFIKPHRSYIVNMDYIDSLTSSEIITSSQTSIPISRNCSLKVKNNYMNYIFT